MKPMALIAAIVLCGGSSLVLVAEQNGKTTLPAGEKLEQLGSRQVDAKTSSAVREAVADLVNSAVTAGKFPAVVGHLTKADRERIGDMPRENYAEINKVIEQFRADYKNKYKEDFAFKADDLKGADINFGVNQKAVTVALADLAHKPAGANAPATAQAMAKDIGISVVSGPTITLLNEAIDVQDAWQVDIPNEITGKQLKGTLTRHLKKLDDQKSVWPEDAGAMHNEVAMEILQALTDTSMAVDE
jgi:hypothetical protein